MRDVNQGRLLLILSPLAMVAYFWAVFLSDPKIVDPIVGLSVREWALIIPVLIFVYLFLFVVAWIGWAMATTPPPLPLKGKEESEEDKSGQEK